MRLGRQDFSELNLVIGYNLVRLNLDQQNKLNIFGIGYYGQNKSKITTELLGQAVTDNSVAEFSYGGGVTAQLEINYILIELGTRVMSSKSYEPQVISVTDLRLGFQIDL